MKAQGHGNRNGEGIKQRETSQDPIPQVSVPPSPIRVMKKEWVLWQGVTQISQEGLHGEYAHLNSVCIGSLWGKFLLFRASLLALLEALLYCLSVATEGASSWVPYMILPISEM